MKTLLLIFFTLLLGPQIALTSFSGGTLLDYKNFISGKCHGVGAECNLASMSSCWNDDSASAVLSLIYDSFNSAASTSPEETPKALEEFYSQLANKDMSLVMNGLRCEEGLSYPHEINEKLDMNLQNLQDLISEVLRYASANPESCFSFMKKATSLLEEGNFKAAGKLDGSWLLQLSAFKHKKVTNEQGKAWDTRYILIKGVCKALDLNCPMDSMTCWNEQASAAYNSFLYEWVKAIATNPAENGHKVAVEYVSGKGKDLMGQIPVSVIECDKNTQDVKLINAKLRTDIWSREWFEAFTEFPKEFPEANWHFNVAALAMWDKNDLEATGMIGGLEWFHVMEWKKGRLSKKTPSVDDL